MGGAIGWKNQALAIILKTTIRYTMRKTGY